MMKHVILTILIAFVLTDSFSQNSIYPQNYFRDPLNIPIQLAASFGELRPNHFHMGLDVRTQSRENLPIYAAADGYVSKVKIEKGGFGQGLYITYPKGYVTVYAHLNAFYDALAEYVKAKQYETESWEQELDIPAGLFPVKKGQFVARSGNTGASSGPHLHFEIRDAETGNNLNPQLFGFDIPDKTAPLIHGLYWYDRRYSTYQVDPHSIPLTATGHEYKTVSSTVKVGSPVISLGIRADDRSSATPFRLGIYHAELWMDETLANTFTMNDFSYDDTRYINACIDYPKYMRDKVYVQHLSVLPGNKINIFEGGDNGILLLKDTSVHHIKIIIVDVTGNSSTINFSLRYDPSLQQDYMVAQNSIAVYPNKENFVESENAKIHLSKNAVYDVVPFVMSEQQATNANEVSPAVSLDSYEIPVHDYYTVDIKTTLSQNDIRRNKTVARLISGTFKDVMKGEWQGDWMSAKFNRLGIIQLLIDDEAPVISSIGWANGSVLTSSRELRLRVKDDLEEIDTFRAELDGKWLMFARRGDDFIYHFDQHCSAGKHVLKVTATDVAGNTAERTFEFIKR